MTSKLHSSKRTPSPLSAATIHKWMMPVALGSQVRAANDRSVISRARPPISSASPRRIVPASGHALRVLRDYREVKRSPALLGLDQRTSRS